MKLLVLGSGSASPQLHRNPSSFLLQIDNEYILIDCGEGTQYRLLERKIKTSRIRTICISHLHGDHYFGLVGLLSSFTLNARKEPILLVAPKALKTILDLQFAESQTSLSYDLQYIFTDAKEELFLFENELFSISKIPLTHRIKTTGYLITKKEGDRHIKADLLPENFPFPYIHQLKKGKSVTDELSGKHYSVDEYTTEGQPSKTFAYCSDTAYKENIVTIIKDADCLYHEATFLVSESERAEKTFHSTAADAGKIASLANVKKLLIGHFSSRYKEYETHLIEAKSVFQETELALEGFEYTIA